MRRGGAGKRRDANEPQIIALLRDHGWQVWQINGRGLPDLLTRSPWGRWLPLEVKTEWGRLTDAQREIRWPIVCSVEDVLALIKDDADHAPEQWQRSRTKGGPRGQR